MTDSNLDSSPASCIYEALIALADPALSSVPPGMKAKLFRAIDDLRGCRAPAVLVRHAQQASLMMHELELAMRRRDTNRQTVIKQQLCELAEIWLESPIVLQPPPAA